MFQRLFDWLVLKPHVVQDELERFQIPENGKMRPRTPERYYLTYPLSKRNTERDGKIIKRRVIHSHPAVRDYLWNQAGVEIPRECCWVIQGEAAFANPQTNIIFAKPFGARWIFIRISDKHACSLEHRVEDYVVEPAVDPFGCRWIRAQWEVAVDKTMLAMAYEDSKVVQHKLDASCSGKST